jgi:hypothetical protein
MSPKDYLRPAGRLPQDWQEEATAAFNAGVRRLEALGVPPEQRATVLEDWVYFWVYSQMAADEERGLTSFTVGRFSETASATLALNPDLEAQRWLRLYLQDLGALGLSDPDAERFKTGGAARTYSKPSRGWDSEPGCHDRRREP